MFKFLFVLLFFLWGNQMMLSQVLDLNCVPENEYTWQGQIGGLLLPSEGTINALIIFAQFPDDNYTVTDWPAGQPPTDMQSWVDQTWSATPTQGSLTHYFNEMSFNKLKFIGKTVSVITPHSRDYYISHQKIRRDIHIEIFQYLDQTMDFAEFDNWDYEGNYNHINRYDDCIDLIIVVWRNIAEGTPDPTAVRNALQIWRDASLGEAMMF